VDAATLLRDRARVAELATTAMAAIADCDALLIPTTTEHPTIAEVADDPIAVNSRLGTYTNFCNLMDLCAVAVPSGTAGEDQFGVSVVARCGSDAVAMDIARLVIQPTSSVASDGAAAKVARPQAPWPTRAGFSTAALLVVGAHLRGQPLAWQLTDRGARWLGPARTAPLYRLARLNTTPPKPGLMRVGPDEGMTISGELWLIGTAMLGDLLASLPAPMALGRVMLHDGSEVVGFACAMDSWLAGEDISHHGDWPTYLASLAKSVRV
jgi:allophanate hydrolase